MAKHLCPICRVNKYGDWFGMVATDGMFCGKCWDKLHAVDPNMASHSAQLSLAQIAAAIGAPAPTPVQAAPTAAQQNSAQPTPPPTQSAANAQPTPPPTQTAPNAQPASAQQSSGGFFSGISRAMKNAAAERAIRKAYEEEAEKRRPRIERIEHRRPLTQQEQQTLDIIELHIAKLENDFSIPISKKASPLFTLHTKKQEILDRAVTIEERQLPPLVDPSVPIVVDEEAIRRRYL